MENKFTITKKCIFAFMIAGTLSVFNAKAQNWLTAGNALTGGETGAGQLNITSANLAPGTYSYALLVNGKVIDTKKMIKQ